MEIVDCGMLNVDWRMELCALDETDNKGGREKGGEAPFFFIVRLYQE